MPNGYHTILTKNGSNLSQGQRQLFPCQAAVADPPVMILDKQHHLLRTEAIVLEEWMLLKDRTVFVIAHRLSTVKNSDVIIVLEQGRSIEQWKS